MLIGVIDNNDLYNNKSVIIRKLYMEAPLISDDAFDHLIMMCELAELSDCAMDLIKELTVRRPPKQENFLNILLKYSVHDNAVIREKSIHNLIILYDIHKILTDKIEAYATVWLNYLENQQPPADLFILEYGRTEPITVWNENLTKICLSLYLSILPYNEKLIHKLCHVYKLTTSEMKRTILRTIEIPIKKMGSVSTEILLLIEECPKGSETLITRIIYILTEKTIPNPDLVIRVRDLYQTKVSDVRLLIPVIIGLTKHEVVTALPKLLKLNPAVVKEVFNRLLGLCGNINMNNTVASNKDGGVGDKQAKLQLPLTPSELLVALHNIDTTKVDIKCVIKATSICLTEKDTYTQEILAIVLQQLVEMQPLPTLIMRTIIQSLTLYPRLAGFITNLLQRLIPKQVWRQKIVWDGFLKCCQRLKPASFPVLMTLPPYPLQEALNTCPELRQPMLNYANRIIETQGESVSKQTMDILSGNSLDVFVTVNNIYYILFFYTNYKI